MRDLRSSAFTLVEILIVVVILGILAAITIPLFNDTTNEAQSNATYTELQKIRRHIEVYQTRNDGALPSVTEGDGDPGWGELIGRDHLLAPPVNAWVGGQNARRIVFGNSPDAQYHTNYGWIYDPNDGSVWAAGFDANDQPHER